MESQEQIDARLLAEIDAQASAQALESNPKPAGELSDLTTTFSLFKSYLDKKLIDLKDDLKEEAQNSTAQAAKKLKETSKLTFRYEGNKQQHKFNRGLADKVAAATKALERKNTAQATTCVLNIFQARSSEETSSSGWLTSRRLAGIW